MAEREARLRLTGVASGARRIYGCSTKIVKNTERQEKSMVGPFVLIICVSSPSLYVNLGCDLQRHPMW